jgi:hypothetical protein
MNKVDIVIESMLYVDRRPITMLRPWLQPGSFFSLYNISNANACARQ